MPKLILYNLAQEGVNVDKSDLHLNDAEVRQTQNIAKDPLGVSGGVKKRPGLVRLDNGTVTEPILGGIGVPLANLLSGDSLLFLGRGPV